MLVTVRNGIDTGRFRRDLSWRETARRTWGIPPDALVFGAVARLDPVKGYNIAIEAFANLMRNSGSRDRRLVLVGDGPSRMDLERPARQTGLSDRTLFPGFTDRAHEAYPGFDVFVMPILNEGLPLALVEAMASECCPIATDVGGVPEVITDSTLGWVVPSGDRSRFADAMYAAASLDSQGMVQMGLRAREYAASRFDATRRHRFLNPALVTPETRDVKSRLFSPGAAPSTLWPIAHAKNGREIERRRGRALDNPLLQDSK